MEQNNTAFEYTYSAPQQEEIRRIREKYLPKDADKMEQLRSLDRNAARKGTAIAIAVGTAGTLLLGLGMSCCLVWKDTLFFPGIFIGCTGIAAIGLAYPLFAHITKQERQRIAPEILRLTEELLK